MRVSYLAFPELGCFDHYKMSYIFCISLYFFRTYPNKLACRPGFDFINKFIRKSPPLILFPLPPGSLPEILTSLFPSALCTFLGILSTSFIIHLFLSVHFLLQASLCKDFHWQFTVPFMWSAKRWIRIQRNINQSSLAIF